LGAFFGCVLSHPIFLPWKKPCYPVNSVIESCCNKEKLVLLEYKDRKAFSMIYIFRKEMKKWHTVLWVVFAALALGSGLGMFVGRRGADESVVGNVDGKNIYFNDYRRALKRIMAPYMQLYGMSEDKLLNLLSQFGNLDEMAFNICVEDKLINDIQKKLKIKIDKETFNSRLIESIPGNVLDENGKVNIETYHNYLKMLSTNAVEYEKSKLSEFKSEVVKRLIANSYTQPEFFTREVFDQEYVKKNFEIAEFGLDYFLTQAKKITPDVKSLEDFYAQNKENYRIPDKYRAKYWELAVESYEKNIEIDEQSIKSFYDKNKSSLFRIAPKVKVRKILIKKNKGVQGKESGYKRAEEIHQKAKQAPEKFAELAKQYSEDIQTSKNGGVVDFFSKGKYHSSFETAAFKLKEPNQISDIIVTDDGYEIVQLVERIKAIEKPLEAVKSEIVNSLRSKRAVAVLQGELGIMMHKAREDASALDAFAKDHSLQGNETDWLTEKDITDADVLGQISQRMFSTKKQERALGYFKTTGKYVIYKLIDTQKSYLPNFTVVKDSVLKDYYKNNAIKLQLKAVSQIKSDILNSQTTLKDAATRVGVNVVETGFIKKGDKVQGFDEKMPLISKMFVISDKKQVLQDSYENDYYLVTLKAEQADDSQRFEDKKEDIKNKENLKESRKHANAFIASLLRNAKIDMDKKVLSLHRNHSKDI
jgi:peptidyl-prolyl cis-trans isomerase D